MSTHRIGVISDTHGLLRPEALDALAGSELIIHAGDVGRPRFSTRRMSLRRSWPCAATSTARVGRQRPEWQVVAAGPARFCVLHDANYLGHSA